MNRAAVQNQATFALRGRNPDVLTCIANLSNDEVFIPRELANRTLDTLIVFFEYLLSVIVWKINPLDAGSGAY